MGRWPGDSSTKTASPGWQDPIVGITIALMALVIRFNGRDLPVEMQDLSPGEYVVEVLDEPPPLSPEDEAGLRAALASLQDGKGVNAAEVRRRIEALLA